MEVSFNLRGREWTNKGGEVKFFSNLDAWRIDKVQSDRIATAATTSTAPTAPTDKNKDDLPF